MKVRSHWEICSIGQAPKNLGNLKRNKIVSWLHSNKGVNIGAQFPQPLNAFKSQNYFKGTVVRHFALPVHMVLNLHFDSIRSACNFAVSHKSLNTCSHCVAGRDIKKLWRAWLCLETRTWWRMHLRVSRDHLLEA